MQDHYILCGLGRVGSRVLNYLRATGGRIVVIDISPPESDVANDAEFIHGDCRRAEVLRQADIDNARGVFVLTSDDLVNLSTALKARQLNANTRIVVRMFNPNLIPKLGKATRNIAALSTSALTAPMLAFIASEGEALGAFTGRDEQRRHIVEIVVRAGSPLRDKKLADVVADQDVKVIGHKPRERDYRLLNAIELDTWLKAGDRVIVCGKPEIVGQLRRRSADEEDGDIRWAGMARRYARVALHTLAEIDWRVQVFLVALILVIVVSTLILYETVENLTIADAFVRTISVMATMADLGAQQMHLVWWQKLFIGSLRLFGMVLIAAFTALLTSYLVRAQLKGALEIRRIPEKGHIVVIGLGNVGYRVVYELLRDGEQVVVVERNAQNPFIATARRHKAAVVVGDGVLREVLKQANVTNARAVVVATSNDLVNVEITLLVRDLNPSQRMVVRLTDNDLATTLREAADIRMALSIPDLAAPAFVAALFGDHVHSVIFVEGRLLAAVDLVVSDENNFLFGQSVNKLASEFNLHVMGLGSEAPTRSADQLSAELRSGDCLTVVVDLVDLQRLLQREKTDLPRS